MKIFRYKGNGLLYTITMDRGHNPKVHPFNHNVEVGVSHKKSNRFRDFKYGMEMDDFEVVSEK